MDKNMVTKKKVEDSSINIEKWLANRVTKILTRKKGKPHGIVRQVNKNKIANFTTNDLTNLKNILEKRKR